MFLFFKRHKCHKQKWRVLFFYTHQTNGAWAGACACDRTRYMEKTEHMVESGIELKREMFQ